ncbi:MAG: TlpA disulfide reductase family protein [Cytophagales bacterium]
MKGKIENALNEQIILYEFFGSQTLPFDTAELVSGEFTFEYSESIPRGFYKIGFGQEDGKILIIADENIEIKGEKGQLAKAEILNSKENNLFKEYQKIVSISNSGIQSINQRVSKARSDFGNNQEQFEAAINKIRTDYDTLIKWQHVEYKKLYKSNPKTFVGKISNYFAREEGEGPDQYLGLNELNDHELLRGDMFKTKYLIYYQQFLGSNFQVLKNKSQEMIRTKIDAPSKEILYAAIIESFAQSDKAFAGKISKAYLDEFPNSDIAKAYFSSFPQGPPDIGDEAPDILLENPQGEQVALSSLRGQVVLLDFWASWCGPCRRENPNVVRTYEEYKDKGFTVYSVSLDNSKDKWVNAIQKDNLSWESHVSDLKGWRSQAAALYGVRGIPATFLLDQNGVIIAKNLRGSSLENKIKEILGAN